jgi:hypothetical protein
MRRRAVRFNLSAMLGTAAIALLAACGSTAPSSDASVEPVASPGEALGAFPGVEGFAYRLQTDVGGFLLGVQDTLGDQVDVEIGQAAVATRGEDEVSLVAFGFPGTSDTQAVDFFARVLDDMEDGFQAPSQRGLGGDAYLMRANGQTVVLAPWGRTEHLIFLFALGPERTTEELAAAILDAGS